MAKNSKTVDNPSKQSKYNVTKLLVIGLIFHLVYIGSIFDCYFTSPVVKGMTRHSTGSAEAKRLVLIVGDGLRADLLLNVDAFPSIPNSPQIVAPYLRSIVEKRGAFGISHTRVPTESRPGHVAIIGGMYEDVSAVTKGWKTNPVDFDSVFNQSTFTFSFGSPDILPMFSRGATPGKVKTWSYDEEEEDFTKDATALDVWVLDHLRSLLRNATTDSALNSQLRSQKVVIFLHLLGLDTTGHSYRPHSQEYMKNIQVVDDIVRQTETLMSEFYQDEQTSYIFTADHGMSVIGNHGDGDPDNTRTPLIAWGRGIRGPLPDSSPSSHDAYSKPWQLGHLFRRDVEQADIASLMSSLLGIDWPVNSVGVLPDVDPTRPGFLSPHLGDEAIAHASLVNAKVILEHYKIKHELKQARTIRYKPFAPLEGPQQLGGAPLRVNRTAKIEEFIRNQDWYEARKLSAELIQMGLAGLHYLQTYERSLIRGIVTAAYTGWAAYASLYLFRPLEYSKLSPRVSYFLKLIAAFTLIYSWIFFAIQHSPWTFYLYMVFPCYFWQHFLEQAIPALWNRRDSKKYAEYVVILFKGIAVIAVLQGMVVAYTHRYLWGVGFLLIGVVWPLTWSRQVLTKYTKYAVTWSFLCLTTGIFPLLSVEKQESVPTILSGGVLILVAAWFSASRVLKHLEQAHGVENKRQLARFFSVQALFIVVTMVITTSSALSLQAKAGLPLPNQISGWIVLVAASLYPFMSRGYQHTPFSKFLVYFLGFGPCFVILSISVEGLFYVSYSATLVSWIMVESIIRHDSPHPTPTPTPTKKVYRFQSDDLRMALFFLFFVQVGFFGTGNVASISSFYLEPVYRLIPIFSPFFMAALLIFKIVAPYIILSVASALLNDFLRLPPFSLLLVALSLTDGMTLTFFFNVKDTGSWLEIGQSISFFCITSLLLLWAAGISAAGEYILADTIGKNHPVEKDD
ncbi:Phosphatidylinositolglycan class N-domain-containing protein [Collybia nuda]|uniref:GPI ethanolamine phosphate transferase 1 n=1 Tax=Collybia nuda TaxID=64659 RepID=A0A9P6CFP7_9AGAR|nr:Phosphatidylinositolglycan class N-domain-containing protein [Collybia nuda]